MAHAAGVRLPFEKLPAPARAWVDRALGSAVISAATQQGGFSPGVAARLVTASGRRAFVKAVGPSLNPKTPELFRQEITAVLAIGPLPTAPALYDVYDDGDWVGLLFEDIEGRLPAHPWEQYDADRVLDAVAELTDALDPSPWPDAPVAAVRSAEFLSRWDNVIADGLDVPAWAAGREAELAELARTGLRELAQGKALAHWDLRSDNIILTNDRVVFIDWAHPALAPRWADTVILHADMREAVTLPKLPDDV
ncbi:aminoglycoside phosphotransferase family protein, partial [Kribbella turkmenica]